jgi:hypothetical protein
MNLAVVVYTNETNIPVLDLFFKYFFKHNSTFNTPIYAVANKFTKSELPYSDKVTYLNGNVPFHNMGGHFSQTLINVLPQIEEDYIFYFCEDYILSRPIDVNALENLLKLIQDNNVDMFSFASSYPVMNKWPIFDASYSEYDFEKNIFYQTDNQYQHAYSVQPCIWKKSSLQQLLADNPEASLHDMDNSKLNNKDQYKLVCTNFKIYDGCCPPEYFIIEYVEIIRHGVFLMALNGHDHMENTYQDKFLKQLIKENDLHNKSEYNKYIGFDKALITW